MSARRCRSTSPFGDCWRMAKHRGIHGVPIGDTEEITDWLDGFWYDR